MEYFLETSHLDAATADMLKKYDQNGDGSFSKAEVVAIILDLRETMRANETLGASNKFFKRLLMAAFVFCALLLTSMFGLSYAVAAITAKTQVKSDGTMMSIDGTSVIATASAASKFDLGRNDDGKYCISPEEMQAITEQVFSGRNVLVEYGEFTENHKLVEQLQANGADIDEVSGAICFEASVDGNRTMCLLPTHNDCVAVDSHGHRKLMHKNGGWPAAVVCWCGVNAITGACYIC
jgi:hypothetical protein